MTAVGFARRGDEYAVRFNYDPAAVSLIKHVVPSYARRWSAPERTWWIGAEWADLLAAELRLYGHSVTGVGDRTAGSRARTGSGHRDTWAHTLFRAVGATRTTAVYRVLSKVLHPDTATGDATLQRQLNDAKRQLDHGGAR